ncbi:NAD(P)-dependent oxidoreductase [Luteolibacter flavescens]|uniref:NAD(P)-dependent oxidoreductase n=1 Tax=Luteolibacter flavescens TaxID=1859460 RepID=A0ABT3FUI5_9BACT|nr:NAD(P)-dependent oxidoreductase [Luteolibacter flavescens]MCW1887253.1 NAD(P)-dependent oxidoreductase [Luteolibacter flavescens]
MSFDTIAVLGLGIIGSRAASNLEKAGRRVRTWNRTPKGLPTEAASVEDAIADADLVLLYLKDAPAVREIAARIFAAPARERVLVNHATIDLPTTRWLAEECAARGIGFLDCPFTGSREAAAGGALVYYAGGDDALIDRVEPVLLQSGKSVLRCGATGTATVMKLVTNLISACTVQALAESLATATSHGIAPAQLVNAVSLNACGSVLAAMKLPTMAKGEFDTHFSLSNMLKDSRYVLDLAAEAGLETPAIRTVSQRMQELCDQGLADRDYSALAAPYVQTQPQP